MDDALKGRRAWDLARSQHWLITFAQLIGCGFKPGQIQRRLVSKRLWLIYPGVYAVGHDGMTPDRERMAAVLASGEDAAISHFSAALHRQIWEGAKPLREHVSIPTRNGRAGARRTASEDEDRIADRILIHRPRVLTPTDIEIVDDIPTTTLTRTLQDLAHYLKPWQLRGPMRQAERLHDYDLRLLKAAVEDASRGNWRAQRVNKALRLILRDPKATTQTERESLYLDICRRHGLPRPTAQHPLGTRRADFAFEALRLIVEVDDRQSHDTQIAFLEDRKRDRAHANRGFETVRFTVAECRYEPALVAADTRAAIARRVEILGLDPAAWGLGSNRHRPTGVDSAQAPDACAA